jgi:hypothetical protein
MQKVESVNLQPLELLLELLLETRRRAGRIAGEATVAKALAAKRQFDEDARDHA